MSPNHGQSPDVSLQSFQSQEVQDVSQQSFSSPNNGQSPDVSPHISVLDVTYQSKDYTNLVSPEGVLAQSLLVSPHSQDLLQEPNNVKSPDVSGSILGLIGAAVISSACLRSSTRYRRKSTARRSSLQRIPQPKQPEKPLYLNSSLTEITEKPLDLNSSLTEITEILKLKSLNLICSTTTIGDGNCWFRALMDQLKIHHVTMFPKIGKFRQPKFPNTHEELRQYVLKVLPRLPQFKEWKKSVLTSELKIGKFLADHKMNKQWTDEDGIIVQASALIIGRKINIVGSVDYSGQKEPITIIEGGHDSENLPHFNIAYLQDIHFQSLRSALPSSVISSLTSSRPVRTRRTNSSSSQTSTRPEITRRTNSNPEDIPVIGAVSSPISLRTRSTKSIPVSTSSLEDLRQTAAWNSAKKKGFSSANLKHALDESKKRIEKKESQLEEEKQVVLEAKKASIREETLQMIRKETGPTMACPDCQLQKQRGGGMVTHRTLYCKNKKF